jgi:hypothetical protein
MFRICFAILLLLLLRRPVCDAARAIVDFLFAVCATFERRLGMAIGRVTGWLARSGSLNPVEVLVGLFLSILAGTVAYADYTVLLASLDLIWPSDAPPAWLAFSIVALAAAVGILTHSVRAPLVKIVLIVLTILLAGTQGTVAYMRTAQLASIRAIAEARPSDDDGKIAIAPGRTVPSLVLPHEGAIASIVASAKLDWRGPAMAAGIAVVLCLSQIAAAWGAISFAGGALTWLACFPALVALLIPWLALGALSTSRLRDGLTLVFDGIFAVLQLVVEIPAKIAPFPTTPESLRRRLEWRNRRRLVVLQEREDSAAALFRASVEGKVREAEGRALEEFLAEYSAQRRTMMVHLLEQAFRSAQEDLQHLPEFVVRMWFWPLDKAWHLTNMVRGGPRFPSTKTHGKDSIEKEDVQK